LGRKRLKRKEARNSEYSEKLTFLRRGGRPLVVEKKGEAAAESQALWTEE